ncbi:hypothetical protein DBR28_18585 [Chryseobacterium sp. HMWF028]|nr:hypothetical protein DBR28_18585 [Chryseobacterium sp. HMWF028]
MRKPKLELDIETLISEMSREQINKKRQDVLVYCIQRKNIKDFDNNKLSHSYEKVQFYSVDILTFRYEGELLFREFTTGKNLLNKRYELAENLV